jgi:two-component system response regulator NreC
MTRALLASTAFMAADDQTGVETLTPREVEVLRLIAQGYTNRQIADLLALSVRTVESHRAHVMEKLNLHSRVELVRYAAKHGLFNPAEL